MRANALVCFNDVMDIKEPEKRETMSNNLDRNE